MSLIQTVKSWVGIPARKRAFWLLPAGLVLVMVLALAVRGSADSTVRLVRMEPSGEVTTRSHLVFTFSGDVVPKSRVGKVVTTNQIKFRPAVPGKIRWETPRRLRYLPEVTLRPSTQYTVEFLPTIGYELKKTLVGERVLRFSTERFRILEGNISLVYNPERRKGLLLQARLRFNYPVSAEALQRGLTICFTDDRRPLRFTVQLTNAGREALVTSELLQRSQRARRIELSLPEGFLCLGAGVGLEERYVLDTAFRERRSLTIEDVSVESDNGSNTVRIACSEPVDGASIENFITVRPAVKYRARVSGEALSLSGEGFKAGRTYEIRILKGMPSLNGNPLERDFAENITFPDLEPSVGFNAPGRYLSSKGNLNIGLETVNISQVEVEVAKIYANNLVSFLGALNDDGRCYSSQLERLGRIMDRETIQVAHVENEVVTTPLNLKEYLSAGRRGVFQVAVCDPEDRWRQSAKVVIVTDLGILAKMGRDELIVWVNSLDDLSPRPGTRVSLISFNNQEIAAGETDEQGVVRLSGIADRLKDFRSYVIVAQQDDDVSFVCLADSLIDTADFPVDGRPHLVEGYESFLYTDRGVFRPGEKANVVAVVRGPNAAVPPEFPVRLEVVGPDGLVFREYTGSTRNAGVCSFEVELPDYARTGKYTAVLSIANQPSGDVAFSVEEFMPDRIKVETDTDKGRYGQGDAASVKIRGVNLFGPPAAGRRVDLYVRLEPVPFSPPAYRSYTFGDPSLEFAPVEEELGWGELDNNGQAAFTYDFPENVNPPGMIRAVFQATVTEDGGRAVSSYKAVEYHPRRAYIGLKRGGDEYAKVGEAYPVKLVEVDSAGQPLSSATLDVEIYSVTWNSIYRRDSRGHYTYQSERQEDRIGRDTVKLAGGEGTYSYRPQNWGSYKLVFKDPATGARSAFEIYATGWGYAPWAMDHPDRIQLDLNKATYKPGESATVQIKAPFAGRALVTVEREKVYETLVVDLKENTGVVTIPVKEEYRPNVYVSVQVIRVAKKLDKRAPTRAFGTIPLTVDCSDQKLAVSVTAVEEMRPNQEIEALVSVSGGAGETYVTLAAVDEGICQLTDFKTPEPWAYFYGKRSLGLETYDLYGMLLPELETATSSSNPGGDADMEGVRRRNLNPVSIRRVKPVSLWSGLVRPDAEGRVRVKMAVPQFNGTLRLMAVAVSGQRFGSGTTKVLVRDPIVMTPTFPRFMAPGDRVVIPVSVFNGTGREGTFEIKLAASGPVSIDGYDVKSLTLADKQEKTVNYAVVAGRASGGCRFTVEARGNGSRSYESIEMGVRPPYPLASIAGSGTITAQKPVELALGAQWFPGTAEHTLALSAVPSMRFGGGLRYLLRYPYGCIEQTTSKVFPLLYLEDLAQVVEPGLAVGGKAGKFIMQGIERIQSMQLRNGSFSYWPGSDWSCEWGTLYASHFLVEARRAGYSVSDRTFDRMLGYLGQVGRRRADDSYELQQRVYALYVLSLAGKPQLSSLAYIRGQRMDSLYTDSRAQLAAAYFYAGDKKTAREICPNTFAASTLRRQTGGNFNSSARSDAIILAALADMDPAHPAVPKLIERLSAGRKVERWGNTQENAYALMALGKILKRKETTAFTGEVLVAGQRIATFDSKTPARISDPRLGAGKVTIRITGTGECYYFAESSGVPLSAPPESDNGISIRRSYLDRSGRGVDLRNVRQGDLLVVRITVRTEEDDVSNVAIADLLPAGLEIENPRLSTSAKIDWLSDNTFSPSYMDIRDDRLLLFASFGEAGTRYFYYAVRVVSAGTFVIPAIRAECMYESEISSAASSGTMEVTR